MIQQLNFKLQSQHKKGKNKKFFIVFLVRYNVIYIKTF